MTSDASDGVTFSGRVLWDPTRSADWQIAFMRCVAEGSRVRASHADLRTGGVTLAGVTAGDDAPGVLRLGDVDCLSGSGGRSIAVLDRFGAEVVGDCVDGSGFDTTRGDIVHADGVCSGEVVDDGGAGAACGAGGMHDVDAIGGERRVESGGVVAGGVPCGNVSVPLTSAKTLANREKRWKKAASKRAKREVREAAVPEWRRGSGRASVREWSGGGTRSVRTVDTNTAEEIEAARTLAARRVMENNIAIAKGRHVLASLADESKTAALKQLDVARIEERVNSAKARSQASHKKCAPPQQSVGSALSAGDYAFKQEIKKREAAEKLVESLEFQLEFALARLSNADKMAMCELELPHIKTYAEIDAEEDDESPYLSYDEMEAEFQQFGLADGNSRPRSPVVVDETKVYSDSDKSFEAVMYRNRMWEKEHGVPWV